MTNLIRTTQTHLVLELTSESGHKYEIGYPIELGYTKEELLGDLQKHQNVAASFLEVNWVPGAAQTSPSRQVIDRGIEAGYVSHDRGVVYEYRLNFKNTKGWSFKFKDKTNDVYSCSTIRNGWHYIDYNSKDGTIIAIS